jgi:Trypsin
MPRLPLLAALAGLLFLPAPAAAIVGGAPATRDYPHMAALELRGDDGSWSFICGASLVRADVVLTAAHCVQDDPRTPAREDDPVRYRLLLGTRDREAGGERIGAVRLVVDPDYAGNGSDVALLKLARGSALGSPIRVAGPGDADRFEPGDEATILGWGATASGGGTERGLREGRVPLVSDADCERNYSVTASFDAPTMICAGNLTGGEDSCQGDSGGPLMVPDAAGQLVLVGDTSFGVGCAFPTQYGVYGEVAGAKLRPWVETAIAGLSPGTAPPPASGGPGDAALRIGLPRRLGSAARARRDRSLRVLLRPTGSIHAIGVTLRRGGRIVASGRRDVVLRSGRVTLKVRHGLRAGRAVLTVSAVDVAGHRVHARRTVSLTR